VKLLTDGIPGFHRERTHMDIEELLKEAGDEATGAVARSADVRFLIPDAEARRPGGADSKLFQAFMAASALSGVFQQLLVIFHGASAVGPLGFGRVMDLENRVAGGGLGPKPSLKMNGNPKRMSSRYLFPGSARTQARTPTLHGPRARPGFSLRAINPVIGPPLFLEKPISAALSRTYRPSRRRLCSPQCLAAERRRCAGQKPGGSPEGLTPRDQSAFPRDR
jgi:hypothetical protein